MEAGASQNTRISNVVANFQQFREIVNDQQILKVARNDINSAKVMFSNIISQMKSTIDSNIESRDMKVSIEKFFDNLKNNGIIHCDEIMKGIDTAIRQGSLESIIQSKDPIKAFIELSKQDDSIDLRDSQSQKKDGLISWNNEFADRIITADTTLRLGEDQSKGKNSKSLKYYEEIFDSLSDTQKYYLAMGSTIVFSQSSLDMPSLFNREFGQKAKKNPSFPGEIPDYIFVLSSGTDENQSLNTKLKNGVTAVIDANPCTIGSKKTSTAEDQKNSAKLSITFGKGAEFIYSKLIVGSGVSVKIKGEPPKGSGNNMTPPKLVSCTGSTFIGGIKFNYCDLSHAEITVKDEVVDLHNKDYKLGYAGPGQIAAFLNLSRDIEFVKCKFHFSDRQTTTSEDIRSAFEGCHFKNTKFMREYSGLFSDFKASTTASTAISSLNVSEELKVEIANILKDSSSSMDFRSKLSKLNLGQEQEYEIYQKIIGDDKNPAEGTFNAYKNSKNAKFNKEFAKTIARNTIPSGNSINASINFSDFLDRINAEPDTIIKEIDYSNFGSEVNFDKLLKKAGVYKEESPHVYLIIDKDTGRIGLAVKTIGGSAVYQPIVEQDKKSKNGNTTFDVLPKEQREVLSNIQPNLQSIRDAIETIKTQQSSVTLTVYPNTPKARSIGVIGLLNELLANRRSDDTILGLTNIKFFKPGKKDEEATQTTASA